MLLLVLGSNGQDARDAYLVVVDAALGANGTVKRRKFNVVADDTGHDAMVSLAQGLDGCDTQP